MLSVADFAGGFSLTRNRRARAAGDSLPPESRRRFKIPKRILECGQCNTLAIRLDSAAAETHPCHRAGTEL